MMALFVYSMQFSRRIRYRLIFKGSDQFLDECSHACFSLIQSVKFTAVKSTFDIFEFSIRVYAD